MNPVSHLQELARQVRGNTIALLAGVPESWLTWAPPGTSNHIVWHAGHALWVQDSLAIARLTGQSELPEGWAETFGMDCRPVTSTTDWPERDELVARLEAQLARLVALFEEHGAQLAEIGPPPAEGWDLVRGIIHALHDEARHQGEMYLLAKLCRAGGV